MDGFVDVLGAVEPRAIAGAIARDAHERMAEAIAVTRDALENGGRGLSQVQEVELLLNASRALDGFEAATLAVLERAFEPIRVREDGDDG
jgi:hypothetical protein